MVQFLTTAQRNELVKLYIAYFNRAPEASGLDYHTEIVINALNSGTSFADALSARADQFFQAAIDMPALSGYSESMTAEEFVSKMYDNVLLRPGAGGNAPTDAEIAYWVNELNNGLSRGNLVTSFLSAVDNLIENGTAEEKQISQQVKAVLDNRVAVGVEFSKAENSGTLTGQAAVTAGQNVLAGVDATQASVDAALAQIEAQTGQSFNLTSAVDTIAGTAGNDTINADITVTNVMSAADSINGGDGVDTLRIFDDATNTITLPSSMTSVENITVHFGGTVGEDLNIASLTDVKSLSIEAATVASTTADIDLTIGAGQAVTLKNVLATTNQTDTVNIAAANSVTSASLTLNGVGDAATAADELNIDIVGGGIATLNLATTGKASNIGLANTGTALKDLNISGDQALTVRTSFDPAGTSGTIDASKMSGDLTFTAATSNDTITFTGGTGKNTITTGSGNDTLTGGSAADTLNAGTGNDTVVGAAGDDTITVSTGSVNVDAGADNDTVLVTGLDSTDVLKGGDGTDTLGLAFADADAADASTTAGAALRATYSGFEQLRVTNDISNTLDISKLGFNYLQIGLDVDNGGAGDVNVNGFTTGATVEYLTAGNMTDALLVGMTDAALSSDDVINIKLNADLVNSAAHATKFGVNGINTVNISAVDRVDDPTSATDNGPDDGYSVALSSAANMTNLNISGSAAVSYTLTAGTDAVKTIDASQSTGNVTIDVSAFAGTERVSIIGSQGINTITGDDAAFGESITGGAKGDTITAGLGADAITGGGGRDAFILGNHADSVASSMDTISDFGKVSVAVLAADNGTSMDTVAEFQATATGKGGADADVLEFSGTNPTALGGAQTATNVAAAEAGGGAGLTITAVESAKGILTLSGADAAQIDTLAEWTAVANTMAAADGDVVAFEFDNNTYLFQQDSANADTLVQLTGVTDVAGISIIGGAAAVGVGEIFVL